MACTVAGGVLFWNAATACSCRADLAADMAAGRGLRPLDVTGGLMRYSDDLSLYRSLEDAQSFRPGARTRSALRPTWGRVEWSRAPLSRFVRGLLGITLAEQAGMSVGAAVYEDDDQNFTTGLATSRRTGTGVRMRWRF